jgi:hypothetical protein
MPGLLVALALIVVARISRHVNVNTSTSTSNSNILNLGSNLRTVTREVTTNMWAATRVAPHQEGEKEAG